MSGDIQLCVLEVGGEDYVVDIKRVEEILTAPKVTKVARAPGFVEGVVHLRGEVVPVVDVRRRLGVDPRPQGRRREKLLICRAGRRRVGLLVDAVRQVIKVSRNDLKPAPLSERPGERPCVLGVCGEPSSLKLLLDVKALVSEDLP